MDQVLESRYVQMQDGRKWTKEKFCRKVKVCSTDFFKKNLLRNNNFNHCIWSKLVQTTQNALYFIHSSLTVTILYLKHFSLGPTCNNRRTVRQVNWSEENLLAFFNLTWTILKTTRFKIGNSKLKMRIHKQYPVYKRRRWHKKSSDNDRMNHLWKYILGYCLTSVY